MPVVKNPSVNGGDVRDAGSTPGSGRSPRGEYGNPLQYSYLKNPIDRGAWWASVHRVSKESDTTEWLSMQWCSDRIAHQSKVTRALDFWPKDWNKSRDYEKDYIEGKAVEKNSIRMYYRLLVSPPRLHVAWIWSWTVYRGLQELNLWVVRTRDRCEQHPHRLWKLSWHRNHLPKLPPVQARKESTTYHPVDHTVCSATNSHGISPKRNSQPFSFIEWPRRWLHFILITSPARSEDTTSLTWYRTCWVTGPAAVYSDTNRMLIAHSKAGAQSSSFTIPRAMQLTDQAHGCMGYNMGRNPKLWDSALPQGNWDPCPSIPPERPCLYSGMWTDPPQALVGAGEGPLCSLS